MERCLKCGHKNRSSDTYCAECGAPLNETLSRPKEEAPSVGGNSRQQSRKPRFAKTIIFSVAVILLIICFTGYQLMSKKYSEEVVIEQFKNALTQKDKQALKDLIVPSDSRVKINDESLDAFFSLLDKNPSLVKEIELGLSKEGLTDGIFSIRKNGSKYLFFDQYAVDTTGYYITIKSSIGPTKIYLNDSEIGVLENDKDDKEFGPLLIGAYTIKGVSDKKEDERTIDLTGSKTTIEVALNTGKVEKEKKKEQPQKKKEETVVVYKEVQKAQPIYSYYIIPHSDYAYLTFEDLLGLSKKELRLARNEIFARHGYVFKSQDLQDYFDQQSWYYRNPSYNGALTAVEEYNVDFIKSYE